MLSMSIHQAYITTRVKKVIAGHLSKFQNSTAINLSQIFQNFKKMNSHLQ